MMDSQLNNAFGSAQVPEFSRKKREQTIEQAELVFKEISETAQESHHQKRPINNDKSKWTMFRSFFMNRASNYGGMVAMSIIALTVGYALFQTTTIDTIKLPKKDTAEFESAINVLSEDELAKRTYTMFSAVENPSSDTLVANGINKSEELEPLAETYVSRVIKESALTAEFAGLSQHIVDSDFNYPRTGNRNQFEDVESNPVKQTIKNPVSTFSIDTDTASYSFIRRQLQAGKLPHADAVRIEEMINYFDYSYPVNPDLNIPFTTTTRVVPSPWNAYKKLIHIGIKAFESSPSSELKSNLVFLIDTSGSMQSADKLPLLISSFRLLLDSLSDDDKVAIVTYAGSAGTVLEPTAVKDRQVILNALESLSAGGSTAGQAGIRQAYALAGQHYRQGAVNRVFLATDGDFNVGISDPRQLNDFISKKRESGVYLSVLGFGDGNYNDRLMQTLAQNGNGQAYYIDTLNEAQKVLVEQASSTLFPVAKDVKIQVEFNPQVVAEYRLIGYETRFLETQDFNNDAIDAAEIGAGHTVTAIYEITPVEAIQKQIDTPRYRGNKSDVSATGDFDNEYAFLKIRYKQPDSGQSQKITSAISRHQQISTLNHADNDVRFAIAVAGFGQLLKQSTQVNEFTYDDIVTLAQAARGDDQYGYRSEFIRLVRLAKSLSQHNG